MRSIRTTTSILLAATLGCGGDPGGSNDTDGGTGGGPVVSVNGACLVDGDCGPAHHCVLGVCSPGCESDADCDPGFACSEHGRCVEPESRAEPPAPTPAPGALVLAEDRAAIPEGGGVVSVEVRNTGPYAARFRVASAHPAVTADGQPREVKGNEAVQLEVSVDLSALAPEEYQLPIQIVTDAGTLVWTLEVPFQADGHYEGGVTLGLGPYLGRSSLELNLEFAEDGAITGQTFSEGSFLWPEDVVVSGTWEEDGPVEIVIRDVVADGPVGVEEGLASPFARDVGREVVLRGAFDASGRTLEGEVEERLTGLADEAVVVPGSFVLSFDGPLRDPTTPADFSAKLPKYAPNFDWPSSLDEDACAGLGVDYGVAGKLGGEDPTPCQSCMGGLGGVSCTSTYDARACYAALLPAAYGLDAVLPPDGADITPPDPVEWEACIADEPVYDALDGTACYDEAAIECAGALARFGLDAAPNGFSDYRERALDLADQVAAETAAGTVLGAELMVQAAFAYQGVFNSNVIDQEIDLVKQAEALVRRPLQVVNSPGFARALEAIEPDVLRDERQGNDVRRAAALAMRYAEVMSLRMRLEHRAGKGDAGVRQASVRHAALWTHLMGARWARAHEFFGVEDRFGELGAFGEIVGTFAKLYQELDGSTNPFGYPDSYVPMLVTPLELQNGKSNYDVVREAALDDVNQFVTTADQAEAAEEEFWQNGWETQQQVAQVRDQYDDRLAALCGVAENGLDPDLEACGTKGGEIFELVKRVELAHLFLKEAQVRLDNNHQRVQIENARMKEIIVNFEQTQGKIDELNDDIWQIQANAQQRRSAERSSWAKGECGRITMTAVYDGFTLAAGCAAEAANSTPWGAGAVATKCAAEAVALVGKTAIQCDAVEAQVGLDNSLDEINNAEQISLTLKNQEIDALLRQSALNDQVTNSEATVKNMLLDSAELSIQVEQRVKEVEIAMAQLQNAITQVASLVARRDRAVALLEDNPQNPGTNPKFLQARLELGQNVLFWREVALRRAYLAMRALEYEMNRQGAQLRAGLLQVRAPEEFGEYMTCLQKVYEDFQLLVGAPQQYVTEISLRDDVLELREPVFDEVEGRDVTPAEQFRAILRDPNARRADGTIVLPFTVSLLEESLFADALCNDRIESLQAKVVGDFVGDGEIDLGIARAGSNELRRCDDAGLSTSDAIVSYAFDPRYALVQAGANDFGTAQANGTFAGWPVGGQEWRLEIPPGEKSPANADLSIDGISDIILRVTHRASVSGQSGTETFEPVCGP